MSEQQFGWILDVDLELFAPESGGRPDPVRSGLRPLWRPIESAELEGLCEVEVIGAEELLPGQSGEALLKFAPEATPALMAARIENGRTLVLMDGPKFELGRATVRAVRSRGV
jgi:hypothetical protein